MFVMIFKNALTYFTMHPILNSIVHTAAGFGIALVLQYYLVGNPFVSVWVGWASIAFSAVVHVYSFMR